MLNDSIIMKYFSIIFFLKYVLTVEAPQGTKYSLRISKFLLFASRYKLPCTKQRQQEKPEGLDGHFPGHAHSFCIQLLRGEPGLQQETALHQLGVPKTNGEKVNEIGTGGNGQHRQ